MTAAPNRIGWATVLIAATGNLIPAMAMTTLAMALPEVSRDLSLSDLQGGSLFSIIFVIAIFSSALAGRLSDSIGRKAALVTGIGVLSLGFSLSSLSPSYPVILGLLGLTGLGYGFIPPTLFAFVSDLVPQRRGLGTSFGAVSYAVGSLLGPLLASFMMTRAGWRAAFLAVSLVGISLLVLQTLAIKDPERQAARSRMTYRQILSRSILLLALAQLFGGAVFWSTASWTPTVLRTAKGLSLQETGIVMGIWGVTPVIGALLLGSLSDRLGRRTVIQWTAYPGAIVAWISFYQLTSPAALAIGLGLFGIFKATFPFLVVALAQDHATPGAVGTASGMIMSMHYVAAVVTPLLTAQLISVTGDMILSMILVSALPFAVFGGLIAAVSENPRARPD